MVGRAVLKAYDRILDTRHAGEPDPTGNALADTEEAIEAEAFVVPPVTDARVIRLTPDINVLIADQLSRRRGLRASAATMIVDAVKDGTCPAGPVQLVISLPMIEAYANVLERRLGYFRTGAEEKAWLLAEYAQAGPMPAQPYLPIGAGFIPFETEEQLRQSIEARQQSPDTAKLFHEVQDDRYVLETALAGRADILVTADLDDFVRGPAIRLQRADVVLFPFGDTTLVVAKPSFAAYWLRQGIVPDFAFIAKRPDEFPRAMGTPNLAG